jgi:hypothetical protein
VIEGGGWVGVGDERTRVAAGEAVLWPADIPHAAWTEHSQMRAVVVEFGGADDSTAAGVLTGTARAVATVARGDTDSGAIDRGEGALAERPTAPGLRDEDAGEPA